MATDRRAETGLGFSHQGGACGIAEPGELPLSRMTT